MWNLVDLLELVFAANVLQTVITKQLHVGYNADPGNLANTAPPWAAAPTNHFVGTA
jgi:hypothetical protein